MIHCEHVFYKRFILYLSILSLVLLWPFDFLKKNHVRWLQNTSGIEFFGSGIVKSILPPSSLSAKLRNGQGLSLEVWLSVENIRQGGPARIVSYSHGTDLRNFTLGQQGTSLVMRLRTIRTDNNGVRPFLEVGNAFKPNDPTHIVVNYDYEKQTIYINGIKRKQASIPRGTLFLLGPELLYIPWK
jgi:hypothetical protein